MRISIALAGVISSVLFLFPLAESSLAQTTPDNFVVAVPEEPDTLDLTSTRHGPGARPCLENITESLWRADKDGNIEPGLATFNVSPDGMEVTFHLRHGVKFHSGDELTADDVIFSHNRMAKRAAHYGRRARNVEKVEAIDRYTVKFIMKRPDAGMLPSRALLIASKAYHDRVGEDFFVKHPVGTGPYEFVKYQPGQKLVLKRFDGYWGKAPQIVNATCRFVHEASTRVAQLQAGEVGMIMDAPYADVAKLKREGFAAFFLPSHPTIAVQFHNLNPNVPWYDRRVREAMAHAIDYHGIITGLLQGIPTRTATVAKNEVGYDPSVKPYDYDPAKSKELLKEAGYPNGFKMPLLVWGSGYAGLQETAEAVVLCFKRVGIDAQAQTLAPVQFLKKVREVSGNDKGVFIGISGLPWANGPDPIEALTLAYSSHSPFSPYRNPKLDSYIDKASVLLDPDARGKEIAKAFALMHKDVATIPLWNFVEVYMAAKGVKFTPTKKWFPVVHLADITLH